jgi:hypothetical protein
MYEDNKKSKKIESRKDLIRFFSKGSLPTEQHFEKLINSNFNKADDNLDIDDEDGLMLYPADEGKLLNFYKKRDDEAPKYRIRISDEGLSFRQEYEEEDGENETKTPEFFIKENKEKEGVGKIGIGTNNPTQQLDVAGLIASQGRIGNIQGKLQADGQWHNVFNKENLNGPNAFEIMAYARGNVNEGRYSLLHAIATCTYGKSKISKTCSHYGKNDKINIRWVARRSLIDAGNDKKDEEISFFLKIKRWLGFFWQKRELKYNLQLRTMSNYESDPDNKEEVVLFYKISTLWNEEFEPRKSEQQIKNEAKLARIKDKTENEEVQNKKAKLKEDQIKHHAYLLNIKHKVRKEINNSIAKYEKQEKDLLDKIENLSSSKQSAEREKVREELSNLREKQKNIEKGIIKKVSSALDAVIKAGEDFKDQRSKHEVVEAKLKKEEKQIIRNYLKTHQDKVIRCKVELKEIYDRVMNDVENIKNNKEKGNNDLVSKLDKIISDLDAVLEVGNKLIKGRIDLSKYEKELEEFEKDIALIQLKKMKGKTEKEIERIKEGKIESTLSLEAFVEDIENTIKTIESIDSVREIVQSKYYKEKKEDYEKSQQGNIDKEKIMLNLIEKNLDSMKIYLLEAELETISKAKKNKKN